MTDNWSLKGKVRLIWFKTPLYSQETIETLRQKLIDDILKFYDANCCLVSEKEKKELIELINRRFGVEEVRE